MPKHASISGNFNFQTPQDSRAQTDQWLIDQRLDHLIPVFRSSGIELLMLWKCSEKELYEMFSSVGLSKVESSMVRERVVLDRHWRGHLFESNVFDELNKLIEEEYKITKTLLEYKAVKSEVDKACDQYLESCNRAVEEIRNEGHELVDVIRTRAEKRSKLVQKAKITAQKHLSSDSRVLSIDAAMRLKQILEKILPSRRQDGFSTKPIYRYKQPQFEMLKRCLKRKMSKDLDRCERWDEKCIDRDIRLENSGSKAVKINKDMISDVRGSEGHRTGIHTWFMRVDGKEFDGKSGVHFIMLGLLVMCNDEPRTYGWCTRTNAPNLLESCHLIGKGDTYALPGETVEITVNIEKEILTFSLPRYGPSPFLTVELQLTVGACIYPWAQLYNTSYDNSVDITAYI